MITYCDVIERCEDCPRYADDCDGDKRVEHTDYISRADAIEAVRKYFVRALNNEPHEIDEDGDDVFTDMKSVNALLHHNKYVSKALKELPSADAEQKELEASAERLYTHEEAWGMCDYISRADAMKAVLSLPMPLRLADEIDETLRLLPSADATQVVRCKDCRFRHTNYGHAEVYDECRWVQGQRPNDDDFCSYGERREP